MLILSRRKAQKVLFPGLDISVEVLGFNGKQVRLGIDAPPEIRVIRDELTPVDRRPDKETKARKAPPGIEATNLALQLAKNQLRQGLIDRAEEAIDHAIECVTRFQTTEENGLMTAKSLADCTVRETQWHYLSNNKHDRANSGCLSDESKISGSETACFRGHSSIPYPTYTDDTSLAIIGGNSSKPRIRPAEFTAYVD